MMQEDHVFDFVDTMFVLLVVYPDVGDEQKVGM